MELSSILYFSLFARPHSVRARVVTHFKKPSIAFATLLHLSLSLD